MSKNDRIVVRHPEGWAVKKAGADRASSIHDRQADAERAAKQTVSGLGGGGVRVQVRDGRWRDSDTISPGNDPYPPVIASTERGPFISAKSYWRIIP